MLLPSPAVGSWLLGNAAIDGSEMTRRVIHVISSERKRLPLVPLIPDTRANSGQRLKPAKTLESGHFLVRWSQQGTRHYRRCSAMVANRYEAEDLRPEPDIEWLGLTADSDGRRDIANAVLADQSRADHGEAAQGQQPEWLLPRAVRERMGTLLR